MDARSDAIVIHGAPASQPTRAVYWTCLVQRHPFELRPLGPDDMGEGGPLLALNPTGQVPTVEDGDFAIFEMPAILIYLCEKHGWQDRLPRDLRLRARVHQYLHFHHDFTRRATIELMAPHVVVAFPERVAGTPLAALAADPDKLAKGRRVVDHLCGLIERGFLGADSPYLCGAPQATIADIACYEELAQLRWANLHDFERFPRIVEWLAEMEKLPHHAAAHHYNVVLGDIQTRPITLQRFLDASLAGVAALSG